MGYMDSAQAYFSEAMALDSMNSEVYYYTGMNYAINKQPLLAIKNLETALRYYPDPQYISNIHYNLGKLYLELGNITNAKKELVEAGIKYKDVFELLKKINK